MEAIAIVPKFCHTVYSDAGALSGAMDGFFSRQACGDICLMYTKIQGS